MSEFIIDKPLKKRKKESKFENELCKKARLKGFLTYKWVSPGVTGVPDRIFIHKPTGIIIFVELKAQDGRLSGAQRRVHAELFSSGHTVLVVYPQHEEEFWETIDNILDIG